MPQPPDPFRSIPPEVLDTDQVAERLKVTPVTVRTRAKDGSLPGVMFGKEWRFWWPQVVIALFYNGEDDANAEGCPPTPDGWPPDTRD